MSPHVLYVLETLETLLRNRVLELIATGAAARLLIYAVDPAGQVVPRAIEGPLETLESVGPWIHQVQAVGCLYALVASLSGSTRAIACGWCVPGLNRARAWTHIVEDGQVYTFVHADPYVDHDLETWLRLELEPELV